MWTFRKPTEDSIQRLLAQQSKLELTYPHTSLDLVAPPPGYQLDHSRVLLGKGDAVYSKARSLLKRWQMFPNQWINVFPDDAPQESNVIVASVTWAFGLWWTNPCRIVEVFPNGQRELIDKLGSQRADVYGFTYGTLPGHVECGVERFLIIRDCDDQVWYDIRAYSRPRRWLVKAAKRFVRRLQKRFVHDSLQRMVALMKTPADVISAEIGEINPQTSLGSSPLNRNCVQRIE